MTTLSIGPAVLIIPALDEEETIGAVIAEVREHFAGEVIVVDNGSIDGTARVAAEAGARVVAQPVRGYGRACMAGVAAASDAAVLVFMDGDGSDRPADIPRLLAAIDAGADLAIGVRSGEGVERGAIAPAARFGNWLAGSLIGLLFGQRLNDLAPLKAIRVEALRRLPQREETYGWTVEMLAGAVGAGLRVDEVEVGYRHRAGGESKVSGQLRASVQAGARILATLGRVAGARWGASEYGALAGAVAGLVVLATFAAWLAVQPGAGPRAQVAVVLAAWPVLLVGVGLGWALGAIGGALRGSARD
jgi:hypothetical protein